MNRQSDDVVKSKLPARIAELRRLALNLRWSWEDDVAELFRRIPAEPGAAGPFNPAGILKRAPEARLAELAADDAFLAHYDRVVEDHGRYMAGAGTWFERAHGPLPDGRLAYFSAEYGLSEALAIYAGGLGVLSGDHLKAASELGLPLVAVGLFYRQGYFSQRVDPRAGQDEAYPDADPAELPMEPATAPDGEPLVVSVAFPGRDVRARVWRVQVGRIPLLLLDTRLTENQAEDRNLTARLYGGDRDTRISQEMILGVGGYRALRAAGVEPLAFHLNEGHSAFLLLEHLHHLTSREGLSLEEARSLAGEQLVFTTHTPVPAGHDHFPPAMVERYVGKYADRLGIGTERLLEMARRPDPEESGLFCMTTLALRSSRHLNGVSRVHGGVTRRMWHGVWPGRDPEDAPIGHVTNGVHLLSWLSPGMKALLAGAAGEDWRAMMTLPSFREVAAALDDGELVRLRHLQRRELVEFIARQLASGRGVGRTSTAASLDPAVLTIGFARRFTGYKRSTLPFHDLERFASIVCDADRPVRLVYAGKAHPRDDVGKGFLQRISELSLSPDFAGRIFVLENYDLAVARRLVQGVDVWLNTPRPPMEASGTSGMKAAANGALNLSTWDGWWAEAWDEQGGGPPIGWLIGPVGPPGGEHPGDVDVQARDAADAESLYRQLEESVVPGFYGPGGGPSADWVAMMKSSLGAIVPYFSADRMLKEYTERYYLAAMRGAEALRG